MNSPRRGRPSRPPKNVPPPKSAAGEPGSGISNLEMEGDRLKVYSLQRLLTNKRSPETREVARLGDVLLPWFEKTVSKPAEKLDGILEVWLDHVPPALAKRSRLVGFHRGTLTVALDSATVRAELETHLRSGLLRTLQMASRGALFRVKTTVDSA